MESTRSSMQARLDVFGMEVFGDVLAPLDGEPCHLFLVGNGGGAMWDAFASSLEAGDGEAHPLDRWTRRVLEPLAQEWNAQVLFPFEGPPWHPFQHWAREAGCGRASPLGILMHPRYGLWHGYRAAFVFAEEGDIAAAPETPFACNACTDKPCLQTCPVGAITSSGLDAARCREHILSPEGEECLSGGCLARRACPVATQWIQSPAQQSFHMKAFARNRTSA